MTSDLKDIFAGLAEKERIKGHHSAEGRAMRVLSRAVNGFMARDLSGLDVVVLCDQAMADWLKARLELSPWSAPSMADLLARALEGGWIDRADAVHLQKVHNARTSIYERRTHPPAREIESALKFCIRVVEKHW